MSIVPSTLNGYPVIMHSEHLNGYCTVLVDRGEHPQPYVVATWFEHLGDSRVWGHYHSRYDDALDEYDEVAERNAKR